MIIPLQIMDGQFLLMVNIMVGKKQNVIKKICKISFNKSHSEYGFIEPIKYFNPSIGISQIVGLDKKNKYVVASLKDNSIYFLI